MNKRIEWIDAAKGIGALLVLMGHFTANNKCTAMIYCFHMPLFFVLSGMVYNAEKNNKFMPFLKNKIMTLLVPMVLFNSLNWIIQKGILLINGESMDGLWKSFLGIIIATKNTKFEGATWFIAAMFIVQMIGYFVIKFCKSNRKRVFICSSIIMAIGLLYVKIVAFPLIYGLDTSLVAFGFWGIGYAMKDILSKMASSKWIVMYIIMVPVAYLNFKQSGQRIEMYANNYGNAVMFMIAAIAGVLGTIGLSKVFENKKQLSELGKYSLYIYGMQNIFKVYVGKYYDRYSFYEERCYKTILLGVILSFIVLIIIWPIRKLYDNSIDHINKKIANI